MNRKVKIYKRFLRCPSCHKRMQLWSKMSRVRPKNHIKTLYCYFCGKLVDAIEEKEFDTAEYINHSR